MSVLKRRMALSVYNFKEEDFFYAYMFQHEEGKN